MPVHSASTRRIKAALPQKLCFASIHVCDWASNWECYTTKANF
jgi:hypothetical protein